MLKRLCIVMASALTMGLLLITPSLCLADGVTDFQRAKDYVQQRDFAHAIAALEQLLAQRPSDVPEEEISAWLMDAHLGSNQTELAMSEYRALLKRYPAYASELHHVVGRRYQRQGKFKEAIATLSMAFEANDRPTANADVKDMRRRLMVAYLGAKDVASACKQIRIIAADYPDEVSTFIIGEEPRWESSLHDAIAELERAIKKLSAGERSLPHLKLELAKCYIGSGQPENAISIWEELLQGNPDEARLLERRAIDALAESEKGLPILQDLIRAYPDRARRWQLALIQACITAEQYETAIPICEEIIARESSVAPNALVALATCMYRLGRGAEAVAIQNDYYSKHPELKQEAEWVRGQTEICSGGAAKASAAPVASDSVATFAGSSPLSDVFYTDSSLTDLNVRDDAEGDTEPRRKYVSNPTTVPLVNPVFATFEGLFVPDSSSTELAVFSDDGVDVYVDGELVLDRKSVGQHLQYIDSSFQVLYKSGTPMTFNVGQPYHIKIEYSNVIYNSTLDLDGCTLYAYNGGGTVYDSVEVTDDGQLTNVATSLHATWAPAGFAQYEYAIGTEESDPGSGYAVDWTSTGSTAGATWTGTALGDGTYYFYVRAKNSQGTVVAVGVSDGITVDATRPTITIGAPSELRTTNGPVTYKVDYLGHSAITLSDSDLSLTHPSGAATGTVGLVGSSLDIVQCVPTAQGNGGFIAYKYDYENNHQWQALTPFTSEYSPRHYRDNLSLPEVVGRPGMSDVVMHPGSNLSWAVLSYQAPMTGTYSFDLNFVNGAAAPGCTTRAVVFTGLVADAASTKAQSEVRMGQPALLTGSVSLEAGEFLRIAIDPQGAIQSDSTVVTGTITTPAASGASRTVCVWDTTGDGDLGIQIAAGTASDAAGNLALAATSSAFTVDNSPPSLTIGAPSPLATTTGPVTYTLSYEGADDVTLGDSDITLTPSGTASGRAGVVHSLVDIFASLPMFQGEHGLYAEKYNALTQTAQLLPPYGDPSIRSYKGPTGYPIVQAHPNGVLFHPEAASRASLAYQAPVSGTYGYSLTASCMGGSTRLFVFKNTDSDTPLSNVVLNSGQGQQLCTGSTHLERGEYLRITVDKDINSITSDSTIVTGSITVPVTESLTSRTVGVWNTTGNGSLTISVAAGTAVDDLGNVAEGAGPSQAVAIRPRLVDSGAAGPNHDGTSWGSAYLTVQDAIAAASAGDQIWVKAGTYSQCITLKSGVKLLGGFDGSEATASERSWRDNETILDGAFTSSVVTVPADANADTEISGFTITNGRGRHNGSLDRWEGGGIYCEARSAATISHNKIIGNCNNNGLQYSTTPGYQYSGGGIFCLSSRSVITNNIIAGNGHYWYDGTAYVYGGVNTFGGGIRQNVSDGSHIIHNTISRNVAYRGAGVMVYDISPSAAIANNIISHNTGAEYKGIYNMNPPGAYTITGNCVFPGGATGNATYPTIAGEMASDPSYAGDHALLTDFLTPITGMDFRLTYGSACIDAVSVDYSPFTDYDCRTRPVDGDGNGTLLPDIGAFEFRRVYVSNSGSGSGGWSTVHTTVQAGIDAALPGDEVWVKAGTYPQCVTLKSGVRLLGGFAGNETLTTQRNWRVNQTIIEGNSTGSAVTVPAGANSRTAISGFTITKGKGRYNSGMGRWEGGGVYCEAGSAATISNNKIIANCLNNGLQNCGTTVGYQYSGGGIFCLGSHSVITNNIIAGNGHYWYNGTSYVYGGISTFGGGIRQSPSGGVPSVPDNSWIANNTICRNVAYRGGGIMIYLASPSAVVANNIISHNEGTEYKGVFNMNPPGAYVISSNCAYPSSNATYPAVSGEIVQNPQYLGNASLLADFTSSIAPMDFHLANSGSACVDAGSYTYAPATDYALWPRPCDGNANGTAGVDIGAYEWAGSILINSGAAFTKTPAATLSLFSTDAGVGISQMQLSNDGVFDTEAWETYAATKSWSLTAGDGTKQVSVRFKDATGNVNTDAVNDSIVVDTTAPAKGTVTVAATSTSSPIPVSYSGVSDSGSGVSRTTLFYKKGSAGTWTNSGSTSTGGSGTFLFAAQGYGTYYFDIVVEDCAGNSTATPSGSGLCNTVFGPARLYVSSAGSNGDGRTWATAKNSLQDAIDAASSGWEIWVRYGTYVPPTATKTFTLKSGVSLYGGFVGTETELSERPAFPRPVDYEYNSDLDPCTTYPHTGSPESVVTIPATADSVKISGFTICHGDGHLSTDGWRWGGGILCKGTNVTIEHNNIYGNADTNDSVGGGIALIDSSATVQYNTITGNSVKVVAGAAFGGGIVVTGATRRATISHNVISGNSATNSSSAYGGGIYCYSSARVKISDNDITGNKSSGISCSEATPEIVGNRISGNDYRGCYLSSCVVSGTEQVMVALNSIRGNGDGGVLCSSSPAKIHGNTIDGNSCSGDGGGVLLNGGAPTVSNNTIASNVALSDGGGIYVQGACTGYVCNNIIAHNTSGVDHESTTTWYFWNNCLWQNPRYDYGWPNGDVNGNFTQDPKLASVVYGNLHIQPDSPCIGAGYPAVETYGLGDIDGEPRLTGTAIDVGADQSDRVHTWESGPYRIIRVSAAGNDDNDGSSWSLTKRTIQAAVDAATLEGGEVWVEKSPPSTVQHYNVVLRPYCYLYGGFDGTEVERSQRDRANETLLHGLGKDVVTVQAGRLVSAIDGFYITGGGRGIYSPESYLTVENNTISGNTVTGTTQGAAAYLCGTDKGVFCNNFVTGNTTPSGKGVVYVKGPLVLATFTTVRLGIFNNVISGNLGSATAIYCEDSSRTDVVNNTIVDNTRAIFYEGGHGSISNNIITGHDVGIAYQVSGPPATDVRNNCFYDNTADVVSPATMGTNPLSAPPSIDTTGHLLGGSPCRDAGYNVATVYPAYDMDYQNRPLDGDSNGSVIVDIGADEYASTSPIGFTSITATPQYADVGKAVTISFTSSQTLSANPTVTVNGHSAGSVSGSSGNYTCSYTILDSDPHGWASIVITGQNSSGLRGTTTSTNSLFVTENCFDADGNRTSVTDARGTTRYEYDLLGRVKKVTDPDGKWVSYEYNRAGDRTKMTDHFGGETIYEYYDDGMLKKLTDRNGRFTNYEHYDNNLIKKVTYPNSTYVEYTYDDCNQLASVANKKTNGTVIANFVYSRDFADATGGRLPGRDGTITKVTQSLLNINGTSTQVTTNYGYDNLYRVTGQRRTVGALTSQDTVRYDAAGNMVSRTTIEPDGTSRTTNYTYDPADRPLRAGSAGYEYNGTTITMTDIGAISSFTYDNRDLLTRVSFNLGRSTISYAYDASGRTVSMNVDGAEYSFRYDGGNVICEQSNGTTANYIRDGTLLSRSGPNVGDSGSYYYFDGCGDAYALANQSGVLTGTGAYDFLGSLMSATGDLAAQPYQWGGQNGGYTVPGQSAGSSMGGTASYNADNGLFWESPIGPTMDSMGASLMIGLSCPLVDENFLDDSQDILDKIGCIPGLGNGADLVNGWISYKRGDYTGAALSAVGLIPGLGDLVGNGGRLLRKGLKFTSKLDNVATVAKSFYHNGRLYKIDPNRLERHHLMPQEFGEWFNRRGIGDIDRYTVDIPRWKHVLKDGGIHAGPKAKSWNGQWADYIRKNPNARPWQIKLQMWKMRWRTRI